MAKEQKLNLKKRDDSEKSVKHKNLLINEPKVLYNSIEDEALSPEAQERYRRMVDELEEDIRLGKAKKYTDITELKNDLRAGI